MSLKDLLLQKLQSRESREEEKGEEKFFYTSSSSLPPPDRDAYLLYWKWVVKHPYFPTDRRRELQFFFCPDGRYVINLFTPCDAPTFFAAFMKNNPPIFPEHLQVLYILLSDIGATVPLEYQTELIAEISGIDKILEIPYNTT